MRASVDVTDPWEQAYLRFETPEAEIRKFVKRLTRLGQEAWPRSSRIVELCCGRGNGLRALAQLGFTDVEGVDLSPTLAAQHRGPGKVVVGDCRELPYGDATKDVVIVQGGLHHLRELPADLERTLVEARRVLAPRGRFVAVEPWRTPFLDFVHAVSRSRVARRLSPKIDAFAIMVHHERDTYENWLARPTELRAVLERGFRVEHVAMQWGKLELVGVKDA